MFIAPSSPSIRDLFTTLIHRFRPLNDTEERTGSKVIVKFPSGSDDQCVSISGKVYMFDKVRGSTASWRCGCDSSFFVFKVLKPNVTQSQVYDATAKNIVKGKLECSLKNLDSVCCRCLVRLQWDHLCLWPDFKWENPHHGGCHQ